MTDAELWVMSDQTAQLESIQLDILCCDDIQELMMDVSYCRQLLQDILSSPHDETRRVAPIRDIRSPWVRRLLTIVGFLPDDRTSLVLTNDAVNLHLLQNALNVVAGVELAVTRSAIPMQSPTEEEDGMGMNFNGTQQNSQSVRDSVRLRRRLSSDPKCLALQIDSTGDADNNTSLTSFTGSGTRWPSLSTSVPTPTSPGRMLAHQGDSQESYWSHYTAGSFSTQSSQEMCPDEGAEGEGPVDYSAWHRVLELTSHVQLAQTSMYKAASEFCKLSGLLCSYGLYQVVCHDQLLLFCRGNTASFSARVVAADTSGKR
jgi:hypothetical protein